MAMEARRFIRRFIRSESGVTAIEYGLLAGLIAVAIIVGVTTVRTEVVAIYGLISNTVIDAVN
jgi:pilus assembly protein Flp/PilA